MLATSNVLAAVAVLAALLVAFVMSPMLCALANVKVPNKNSSDKEFLFHVYDF